MDYSAIADRLEAEADKMDEFMGNTTFGLPFQPSENLRAAVAELRELARIAATL